MTSSSITNDIPELTDNGFDIESIIKGKSKIFIDGKLYEIILDQELINILKIEETSFEKPVTEMFRKEWTKLQEVKFSDDVKSISFVYYKNKIYVQSNAPVEP